MSVRLDAKRRVCGTKEAAEITGYRTSHIRGMATRKEIWCRTVGARQFLYDEDELRRLVIERDRLRSQGKLCGRRPSGRKTA